jgi:hypothetical protein
MLVANTNVPSKTTKKPIFLEFFIYLNHVVLEIQQLQPSIKGNVVHQ